VSGDYVVRAVEADGYLVGIYRPFYSREDAESAAERHNRDGVKTDVMPLYPWSALGSW